MKLAKVIKIIIAGACIGSGVGLILAANIGSDSISVLQDGLHALLHISYGQASFLYNFVLIILALLAARKYFGSGTILSALLTGVFIDIVNKPAVMLLSTVLSDVIIFHYLFFLLGLLVYSFGLAILIGCNLGMNSLDSILMVLSEKFSISYTKLRIGADLLLTFAGWLLNGVVGIGTVISIFFTSILVRLFSKKILSLYT